MKILTRTLNRVQINMSLIEGSLDKATPLCM